MELKITPTQLMIIYGRLVAEGDLNTSIARKLASYGGVWHDKRMALAFENEDDAFLFKLKYL